VEHLHARFPLFDPASALAEIERRETELSTAIGGGVAVPHALVDDLRHAAVAVLRLRGRIPYRSMDGRPVHLSFVLLVPSSNPGLRLRLLGDVARIARSARAVERAGTAKTPEEVVALLQRAMAAPAE
jgi:mannitol/fructose-specific phosphotransferase system IIA component (Ntr-type)